MPSLVPITPIPASIDMRIGGNFVGLGWGLVVREEAKEEEEWRREKGWWVRGRMEGSVTVAIRVF